MAKIVVAGSLNMDLVAVSPRIPVAGETIIGSNFFTTPGGKGANQAYAAAKLGGAVAMVGRVGEDDFGRAMRKNLAEAGCDTSRVPVLKGASGVALIFVSDSGENCIVVVPGANHKFRPEDVAGDAGVFDDCGVALLQLETPIDTVLAVAKLARQKGAMVILDPAPAVPLPCELFSNIDILTPNETEAAILTERAPKRLDYMAARVIAIALREKGTKTVIVKLGEQGCLLLDSGEALLIPAPKVKVVDTTAAGDEFNAAVAVALGEGKDLPSACRFAVEAAALSVTRLGAQSSAPSRQEVDEFLHHKIS